MRNITIKNKPMICVNKDFQTIQINVTFPFLKNDKDIAFYHLLPSMLQFVSDKYPTEREYSLEIQRLYILNSVCTYSSVGELGTITFHFGIPDTYSLGEDLLEEQFAFFSEVMYAPKKNGDAFCEEFFQREVDNLRVNIQKTMDDPVSYAFIHGRELVDSFSSFSFNIYSHPEYIDSVNEENLYQFYQEVILNNQPLVYVFGNVEKEKITNLCKKYFYRHSIPKKTISYQTENYLSLRTPHQEIVEDSQFRNSVYLTFYNVKDMKEEDYVLMETAKNLLTSQVSRLLNKKLRDDHDLVYSSSVITYIHHGIFAIAAYINQNNMDIVKEKIEEVINDLKEEDVIEEYLNLLKERFRLGMIRQLDDKNALFQDFMVKDLGVELTSEEYYKELCEIHAKDISRFVERLQLNTQYFLKEGEHE